MGAGRPCPRGHAAETGREAPPPPSLIFSNDRSRSLGQVGRLPSHRTLLATPLAKQASGRAGNSIGLEEAKPLGQCRRSRGRDRSEELRWPRGNGQSGGGFGEQNRDWIDSVSPCSTWALARNGDPVLGGTAGGTPDAGK